jgi:hypothetical protein
MQKSFLEDIKKTQPELYASLKKYADDGLFVIDEQNDAITATNRLLFTYPDLHLALSTLINSWYDNHLTQDISNIFKELEENNGN